MMKGCRNLDTQKTSGKRIPSSLWNLEILLIRTGYNIRVISQEYRYCKSFKLKKRLSFEPRIPFDRKSV